MTVYEKLNAIQKGLKAPKNQRNNFGNYNYRSNEDILEAVKPLLDGATLTISDEMIMLGNRFYIKATGTFSFENSDIVCNAYAREPEVQKGMSESQITGTASSYARKYCMNGLFLIDDTKDADTDEHHKQVNNSRSTNSSPKPKQQADKPPQKSGGNMAKIMEIVNGNSLDPSTKIEVMKAVRDCNKDEKQLAIVLSNVKREFNV